MSQPSQRQDKARTRASTSTAPSAQSTDPELMLHTPTTAHAEDRTDMSVTTIDGGGDADIRVTLELILQRLDRLDKVEATLDTMSEKTELFRAKHARDVLTAEQCSNQQAADIAHLSGQLDESRRARAAETREHLITKKELANTKELNRRIMVQLNDLENKQRGCNVRLDGVDETDREDMRHIVMDMAVAMGVNVITLGDISAAYRVGKIPTTTQRTHRQKMRTIMVTFTTMQKRNAFYFARTKLRNTEKYRKVFINDDVTQYTRKQRDDYKSVANVARDDGVEVRIHSDGILLNGNKFYMSEPHTLPAKYSLEAAKTIVVGGEIYFASEHSYLSNFASSPITEGDTVFATAEHMYQAYKCKQAGELNRMGLVISAPTPLEAKRLADLVQESPEWRASRDQIMAKVISLKFDQNPELATKLIKTGDMGLNEATHNSYFGIGVPLHAREIKEKSYRGENKLGRILADKRADIIAGQNNE